MLTTNTMRYGTDTFAFNKSGLVYPNTTPWVCTNITGCLGFTLTSNIPSGCDARAGFLIDGTVYKLATDGTLSALATQSYTVDTLLNEGNTVAELAALTTIPGFIGKTITPIFALMAPGDATTFPTLKVTLRTVSNQDQYTKTEYSQEYYISGYDVYNTNLSATVANGGSIVVEASIYTGGTWSDYMALSALKGKSGDKLKFRITYTATTLGTSTAQLNYLYIYLRTNTSVTLGTNADLITKTQGFSTGMMYARLLIKHNRLKDAGVKAYVSFSDQANSRENLQIATGTGNPQTVTLADANIDFSTLTLYGNTTRIMDFDFNTISNSLTFTADSGATVFANYDHGFTAEAWQEMQKGSTQAYAGKDYDSTDFTYSITGVAKGASAIHMVMEKPDGSSTDEYLGVGTGRSQLFVLDHYAKEDTITVKQGTQPINSSNWSYDPVSRIITVIALKDSTVSATYQWTAETPKILGYVAAWNQ